MDLFKRHRRSAQDMPAGVRPPSRSAQSVDPLTMSTVFRGVQILQTAIAGLPINELRAGVRLDSVSRIVDQPDPNRSRRDWISDIVASLCLDGNAFLRKITFDSQVIGLEVLPPQLVTVWLRGTDPASPVIQYSYLGKTYSADQIIHSKFLNRPGELRGLGPISAAREEIQGARQAQEYKSNWYNDGTNFKGYLKTSQRMTQEAADEAKKRFESGPAGGIKVLGSDLTYVPLSLKPADMQFLETQKFDTTQIARLLGIPASIMLAAVDGSNLTYSNIEQSWIEFADYTLAAYTGEIEEALNQVIPRGRTVKFDWDSSRRADQSDRYNAYSTAISSGFLTVNEVRAREGYAPINQGDESDDQ